MSRMVLITPGSSVPSEEIFSLVGIIITPERTSLNMLIFLNRNFKDFFSAM